RNDNRRCGSGGDSSGSGCGKKPYLPVCAAKSRFQNAPSCYWGGRTGLDLSNPLLLCISLDWTVFASDSDFSPSDLHPLIACPRDAHMDGLSIDPGLAPAAFAGYASHLIADSMTPHGVPWLWPYQRYFRIARVPTGSGMDHVIGLTALFGALDRKSVV